MACDPSQRYNRGNIFYRALVKLREGASEKDVEAFLKEKLLPGQTYYMGKENDAGIILASTGSIGFSPMVFLKKMQEAPKTFRPRLSEILVTNLNREAVAGWVEAGEGQTHNLSGFKIFKPNDPLAWAEVKANWDFIDTHGKVARLAAGNKGSKNILEVDRNKWTHEGLTNALHHAKDLAPPELKDLYEQAARHTALYMDTGRIERRLLNTDSSVAPAWTKTSFLPEAEAARKSSETLSKYIDGQLKRSPGEVSVKGLLKNFMLDATANFREIGNLVTAAVQKGLKTTFKADSLTDPRIVLDISSQNWHSQVARELFLAGIDSKLAAMPKTAAGLKALAERSKGRLDPKESPGNLLRQILRDPELRTWLEENVRVKEASKWETILWDVKKELGTKTPALDSIWGSKYKIELTPEETASSTPWNTEQHLTGLKTISQETAPNTWEHLNALYNRIRGKTYLSQIPYEMQQKVAGLDRATIWAPKPEEVQKLLHLLETDPDLLEWTKTVTGHSNQNMWDTVTRHLENEAVAPKDPILEAVDAYDAYNHPEHLETPGFSPETAPSPLAQPTPNLAAILVEDIVGTKSTRPLEPLTEPSQAWVTEGTPVTGEYMRQLLDNIPALEDIKDLLNRTETTKPEALVEALQNLSREYQGAAKFIELWNDPKLQFLENFQEVLKDIGCN